MKIRHLIFKVALFETFICCAFSSYGYNLPSEGEWKRNVIRRDTTIILTGHVELLGTITVSKGCTLEIRNDTETLSSGKVEDYKRIRALSDMNKDGTSKFDGVGFDFNKNRIAMFLVEEGATLRILGKSKKARVTINGGTGNDNQRVYEVSEVILDSLQTDKEHPILNGGAICTVGNLVMKHSVIHNVYSRFQGAGILVPDVSGTDADNIPLNIKTGSISLSNTTIRDCQAGHGAAIMLKNQNTAINTDPEECAVTLTNVNIRACWATNRNEAGKPVASGGGGIIRSNGSVVSNLKLNNVLIEQCKSECHGAGLYWNGQGQPETICTINGCTLQNNYAEDSGGAMVLESSFKFMGNSTLVQNNKAGKKGGGIYIMAYNGSGFNKEQIQLNMDMNNLLTLANNSAVDGGGIAFDLGDNVKLVSGSTIAVNISGTKINNNSASADGGGIYFYNEINKDKGIAISFNLNSGTIDSNHADSGNGGGIFCTYKDATDIQPAELNFNAGTISNNTAINGAGVYIDRQTINCLDNGSIMNVTGNSASNDGGGLFISNGGSLVMNACNIASNSAARGGGICIQEGTFTINDGLIKTNTSSENGGGLYVSNTTGADVHVSGGTFTGNKALSGGGICVSGAHLIMNDGVIEDNTAENGGGFFLCNDAAMDFGNGLIKKNTASAGGKDKSFNTGYQKASTALYGIGGGIFMDSGTTLNFTEVNNLGLYSNLADYGADDIFANGNNTSITLPDVSKMQLKDFNTPTADLYWAEDYIDKDSQYSLGTKINTAASYIPERYRDALNLLHETYKVPGGQVLSKYACLALGYGVILITVEKHGLKNGDSAIFTIARSETPTVPFRTIILTGNESGDAVSRTIAVNSGKWIVTETGWSWNYSSENKSITRDITSKSTDKERLFSFTNEIRTDTPLNDEDVVGNIFKE